jgi:hypothetical protein
MKVFFHLPKTSGNYIIRNYDVEVPNSHRSQHHPSANIDHGFCIAPDIGNSWASIGDLSPRYPLFGYHSKIHWDFCVVRNPFEWLYSYYVFDGIVHRGWCDCRTFLKASSFYDFIDKFTDPDFRWHCKAFQNSMISPLFTKSGKAAVPVAIYMERFESGMKTIGVSRIKSSSEAFRVNNRIDSSNLYSFYSRSMARRVENCLGNEMQLLGYSGPDPSSDSPVVELAGKDLSPIA